MKIIRMLALFLIPVLFVPGISLASGILRINADHSVAVVLDSSISNAYVTGPKITHSVQPVILRLTGNGFGRCYILAIAKSARIKHTFMPHGELSIIPQKITCGYGSVPVKAVVTEYNTHIFSPELGNRLKVLFLSGVSVHDR